MTLEEVLDGIAARVVELRGLEPLREIDRSFMTREELESFLIAELEESRGDILKEQELLAILDMIPKDMDIYQLYLDLYSEQVLGLYDSETEKMYVIGEAEDFRAGDEITFAHEYFHALQQQHFDIHALGEAVAEDSDAQAALRALIEGDAYVLTFQYLFKFLTEQEQQEATQSSEDSTVFDAAPYAIRQLFLFDIEGIDFVVSLMGAGRLDAVKAAYDDPPIATEQILHPEKYLEDEQPELVTLPDLVAALGPEWSQIDSDVMGEFLLRVYLETGVEDNIAAAAAEGWGGDRYVLLRGPQDQRVLVALNVWDTEEDALEFFDVALLPLESRSDPRYLGIQADRTVMVVAPTEALIEAVLAQLPGF